MYRVPRRYPLVFVMVATAKQEHNGLYLWNNFNQVMLIFINWKYVNWIRSLTSMIKNISKNVKNKSKIK